MAAWCFSLFSRLCSLLVEQDFHLVRAVFTTGAARIAPAGRNRVALQEYFIPVLRHPALVGAGVHRYQILAILDEVGLFQVRTAVIAIMHKPGGRKHGAPSSLRIHD